MDWREIYCRKRTCEDLRFHYAPHKLKTSLFHYANDMRIEIETNNFNNQYETTWRIHDRAFATLFLFPPETVEQALKRFPLLSKTEFADYNLDHVKPWPRKVLHETEFYTQIQQLLTILIGTDRLLRESIRNNHEIQISELDLVWMQEITRFYDWAAENYPLPTYQKQTEPNYPKWFRLLCSSSQINPDQAAIEVWNQIKSQSSAGAPITIDDWQFVLHGNGLFRSQGHMDKKGWKKYLAHPRAKFVKFKTFCNYLSNLNQSQNDPKC